MMLTDQEIEKVAKPFIRDCGCYSGNEPAIPDNGDIEDYTRAVIAANNAKMLADLKPATLHQIDDAYDAWELCGDDSIEEPKFYSADTVSALIQDRDALAARVKELESALDLCYEHCRLYHPHVEKNNVGEAVRKALKATP